MQDTMTGAFEAVAIFGYYFAVREKGADKRLTRHAETERTARTKVLPQLLLLPLLWDAVAP